MAAVRRCQGFTRYALSLQYHGQYHQSVSYHPPTKKENHKIVPSSSSNTADNNSNNNHNEIDFDSLAALSSIEGRLISAFHNLVGPQNVENVKISSRTDKGVHALRNTCHVDVRKRTWNDEESSSSSSSSSSSWDPMRILHGLNYHLCRQPLYVIPALHCQQQRQQQQVSKRFDLRILNAVKAPLYMKNKFYTLSPSKQDEILHRQQQQQFQQQQQPEYVDWNARFSATKRTYTYRILYLPNEINECNIPFEHDRAWIVHGKKIAGGGRKMLNVEAMKEAALYMVGKEMDYTTFRGRSCQRFSPIVNVWSVDVNCTPYFYAHGMMGGITTTTTPQSDTSVAETEADANLISMTVSGESFVYRQVRNMVGCLLEVGKGKLQPRHVKELLQKKDRSLAPAMAPAHGLFLVDVEHGDFCF